MYETDLTGFWYNRLDILLSESIKYPEIAYKLYKKARTDDAVGNLRFSNSLLQAYQFVDSLLINNVNNNSFVGKIIDNGAVVAKLNYSDSSVGDRCSIVTGIYLKETNFAEGEQMVPIIRLNSIDAYAIDPRSKLTTDEDGNMTNFFVLRLDTWTITNGSNLYEIAL